MRKRLDIVLVERGLAPSRSRARDLIKGGKVLVDGEVCMKAGAEVDADEALSLREPGRRPSRAEARSSPPRSTPSNSIPRGWWRSTSALRPAASPRCCSTRGAAKVYAVDVGHGQLHASLRDDPRVVSLRGLRRAHARRAP